MHCSVRTIAPSRSLSGRISIAHHHVGELDRLRSAIVQAGAGEPLDDTPPGPDIWRLVLCELPPAEQQRLQRRLEGFERVEDAAHLHDEPWASSLTATLDAVRRLISELPSRPWSPTIPLIVTLSDCTR